MKNGINNWQRRWHPLLDQWVLIAATSGNRPWSGAMATAVPAEVPVRDPECYLCPSVERASGNSNPEYKGTYSFDNDYPSLSTEAPGETSNNKPYLLTAKATGRCRVLCWSEQHDLRLASLPKAQLKAAFDLCRDEYRLLSEDPDTKYVVIFENKGKEVGMSNPHPHGQAYAIPFVSDTAQRMRQAQTTYWEKNQSRLLQDMLSNQHIKEKLIISESQHWATLVPFSARFPYETWVIPKRHTTSLLDLDDEELEDLGLMYQQQLQRYDALFNRETPNMTMFHSAPCDGHKHSQNSCFHIAMQPPLMSPVRLKYLAGWESASGNVTNPVQPEFAAEQLRNT